MLPPCLLYSTLCAVGLKAPDPCEYDPNIAVVVTFLAVCCHTPRPSLPREAGLNVAFVLSSPPLAVDVSAIVPRNDGLVFIF